MDDRTLCNFGYVGVGAAGLTLLYVGVKTLSILWRVFYPHVIGRPRDLKKLAGAKWADGIGQAYAVELASRGFNIALVSRNRDRLDATAKLIVDQHSQVEVKTFVFDCTIADLAVYEEKLLKPLVELEIGVLVNNVGKTYAFPERFDRVSGGLKSIYDLLVLNSMPLTLLSHFVLQQMVKRDRGIVINISSSAAMFPLSEWALYSAIKRYQSTFTEILRKEYRDTHIVIQCVQPMVVTTKMADLVTQSPSLFCVTPVHFARAALRTVGLTAETNGCLPHEIQATIVFKWLPGWLLDCMLVPNNERFRNTAKKRADARAEAAAAPLLTS